jgi:glycosyl transferase family 4
MGALMVKRVLMVAFHFPPLIGSSGIQRTLRFAQHLPEFDWEPAVLSAHPRAYPNMAAESVREIPRNLKVRRAFALDAARHLAVAGVFPRLLALPDRWSSWCLGAVPAGLRLIRTFKPDVLWTTYPVASAHLIGAALQRLTGIPWVADFRDPMAQEDYPADRLTHRAFEWIERRTLRACTKAIFTAPGALRLYAERYPELPGSRLGIIENGYDEASFAGLDAPAPLDGERPLTLVHSGTIYSSERDPRPLFAALGELLREGVISGGSIKLVLRASGNDAYLSELVRAEAIQEIVSLQPAVGYRAALEEMQRSDGLLVLQAANCNYQVPAKLYEYLRARRPILALTDPQGDTAAILRSAGVHSIAPLDSKESIRRTFVTFLEQLRARRAPLPSEAAVAACSRRARTAQLAAVLDAVRDAPGRRSLAPLDVLRRDPHA